MQCIFTMLLLMVIGVGSNVQAQRLIAKTGVNFSTANEDFQDKKIKYGAVVSLGYEYSISSHFLLQADLSFIQKGYKYEWELLNDDYYGFLRRTLNVNYLEIPLVLKYKFNTGNVVYSLLVGQSIGFALGGTFEQYGVSSVRFPPDLSISDKTLSVKFEDFPYPGDEAGNGYNIIENRFDFSLQFGGQIEFFDRVLIDIRYALGLNRFYSTRYDETLPNGSIYDTKHRGWQVCVAVPFKLKQN